MFIELAELLDCPRCARGFGLVAFVGTSDRRRVLSGRLGCPLCEVEFPIVGGAIELADPAPGAAARAVAPPSPPDLAVRVAAVLGLGEAGSARAVALGPALAALGPELARLGGRVEVLCLFAGADRAVAGAWSLEELAAGANPIVGIETGAWPIRAGALDGVAWRGGLGEEDARIRAALRPGGRLVLIEPVAADVERLAEQGFEALAGDETAWVGARA